MHRIKLHDPNDPVIYNKTKCYWVDLDTFEFGDVPFMTTGKHIPRYKDQLHLVNIYLNHKDDLINEILKYKEIYGKWP